MAILTSRLIGEVGLSHEGSLGVALNLVHSCKRAGLDYVKFQHHSAEHESTNSETFRVNTFPQDRTRAAYWSRTSFTQEQWKQIIQECESLKIGFLCTPFSVWSANQLLELKCTDVKIGSGDASNWELLEFCKLNFSRIFLSLGMSNSEEIEEICYFFKDYKGELILFQCASRYPCDIEEVGLHFMRELRDKGFRVGLSDHSGSEYVPMAAIANGASFIEFHVVHSRNQFGPDSSSSLTFSEIQRIVNFRETWTKATTSSYNKDSASFELQEMRKLFGRGLSLKSNLNKGEIVELHHLTLKKPKGPLGWEDRFKIVGKKAKRTLQVSEHLNISDFEL